MAGTSEDRVLTFDLETADADSLFTMKIKTPDGFRPVEGPFVRLIGYKVNDGPVTVTTDVDQLLWEIELADVVQGHNILGFDGLALAWHHGMDWGMFCAKARDTDPASRQHTPPRSREHGSADLYDLDHVAERLGVTGKITGEHGLAALKRKYGGYDRIPVDDPDYVAYLKADVEASYAVFQRLTFTAYVMREHVLMTYAGHMTLNGFKVDMPLLEQRIKDGQEKKQAALIELNEVYGVPLGKTVLRGRKPNKTEHFVPSKAPLATREGKDALIIAFRKLGCKFFPRVAKTIISDPETGEKVKDISTGRDDMQRMSDHYGRLPGVKRLCDLVTTVTTTRTIYQTAMNNVAPDGRIHPKVSMRQASGRLSVTPGMTVFGKHGGRWVEREIFIADEPGYQGVDEWAVITCDLSQVDMRAVAAHCQDQKYMALFEPGSDPHQINADLLGIPRQDAKALGHGWNYGLGAKRMIKTGHRADLVWAFVNGMERTYPRLIEWREEIRDAGSSGALLDNGFGRKMRCDPSWAYTVAPALMGQGTARDITMQVLIRLFDAHPEYIAYLRNHAHDEWIFVVPAAQAEEIGAEIKKAFTWQFRGVPILCELSPVGSSWGECSAKG
jgi:DNA polymerase-1